MFLVAPTSFILLFFVLYALLVRFCEGRGLSGAKNWSTVAVARGVGYMCVCFFSPSCRRSDADRARPDVATSIPEEGGLYGLPGKRHFIPG